MNSRPKIIRVLRSFQNIRINLYDKSRTYSLSSPRLQAVSSTVFDISNTTVGVRDGHKGTALPASPFISLHRQTYKKTYCSWEPLAESLTGVMYL